MDKNQNNKKKPEERKPKNFWTPLMITLVLVLVFSWVFNAVSRSQYTETTWSDFLQAMEAGQIAEVELQPQTRKLLYLTKEEAAKDPSQQKACFTGLPDGSTDYASCSRK